VTGEPILPSAPTWFRRAVSVPRGDSVVEVDSCRIHYLSWGERGRRGLVFVHGGGAHAHWWTPLAATFAEQFRVAAIDLSGHGDSGHRDRYLPEEWADEVMAVASDAGIEGLPVLIGHSMGGFVTMVTAARYPSGLAGVIVCDSPVSELDPEISAYHLRDFVARHSLKPVHGGWQWKFDRRIFEQFGGSVRSIALPYLDEIDCRLALLRSECGLVTPEIGAFMYEKLGRVTPVIEIPEAGHHAMLDQPLLLLTAVRTLLADWDHSEPHRR
jgi:pimeloyl-ACP methyl ester carboxylesterase